MKNKESQSIENPIEKDLKIFVQKMVVSTKKEQTTAITQGIKLRNLLCDYMEQDKTNLAENGDIVVALIDDHEATLKRLRKKGQSIALESANPLYETKILSAHRVKVQGKLIGLLRKY